VRGLLAGKESTADFNQAEGLCGLAILWFLQQQMSPVDAGFFGQAVLSHQRASDSCARAYPGE
jgi:hypothetical protein